MHETSLDRADFHPLKTIELLKSYGWQFSPNCQLTVSDSHMHAAPAFFSLPNCRIVNFDAHHDLGYRDVVEMRRRWKSKTCQCEDWLWFLLKLFQGMEAVQIYPSWKDPELDWPDEPHWRGTALAKRVWAQSYSPELLQALAGNVIAVHIARSSAWVPPWHDHVVADLIEGFAEIVSSFADLEKENSATVPRDIDTEALIASARQHGVFQQRMMTMARKG